MTYPLAKNLIRYRLAPFLFSISLGASSSAYADQVFADDVIIQFSLGVGTDTVNGESFGFDTLRLKENNLRLHFQDTSSSASFPSNDWRLIANDSSNGGLNYFAIEDATAGRIPFRVEAGAPLHALYVDDGGRIGLGTNSPVLEMHVADGDSPGLRLEQDGSSGFTPQTWDVAGNETNFFVRDATNGSKIPFKIKTAAPNNSLFVDTDGDIGLGTGTPDADLHVVAAKGEIGAVIIGPDALDAPPTTTLHVDGTAFFSQTITVGSTRASKENIRDITLDEAMVALDGLNPVQFHYIGSPQPQLGFIAEEVPALVATPERNAVRPMDFVALLTKVVKEQERRERELMKTVQEQDNRIEHLIKRLDAMEAAPSGRR